MRHNAMSLGEKGFWMKPVPVCGRVPGLRHGSRREGIDCAAKPGGTRPQPRLRPDHLERVMRSQNLFQPGDRFPLRQPTLGHPVVDRAPSCQARSASRGCDRCRRSHWTRLATSSADGPRVPGLPSPGRVLHPPSQAAGSCARAATLRTSTLCRLPRRLPTGPDGFG